MLVSRRQVLSLSVAGMLAGCAGPTVDSLRNPVPELLQASTIVPGYARIRHWGDDANGITAETVAEIIAQQRASGNMSPNRSFLSISGGGSDGAFGAGLLSGWTKTGTRPEFTVVTGISTGSLIAPFAFLGRPYDESLKSAYTQVSGRDIYKKKGVLRIIGSQSVADSSPLRTLVSSYVTDTMMQEIAQEHARGRRLLIGTTNLDADRSVVWDIGAIASSGQSMRKELVQDILVASASIPGVFPPVNIKVNADGKVYDEIHVDGGTSNQAFLFPSQFSVLGASNAASLKRNRKLYVIRNGKVSPQYSVVKPKLTSIVGKSISSLIKTQGIGDLYRMYANAQRDHMTFNAIWIPDSFAENEPEPFDRAYMTSLFRFGYAMGQKGIPWSSAPP